MIMLKRRLQVVEVLIRLAYAGQQNRFQPVIMQSANQRQGVRQIIQRRWFAAHNHVERRKIIKQSPPTLIAETLKDGKRLLIAVEGFGLVAQAVVSLSASMQREGFGKPVIQAAVASPGMMNTHNSTAMQQAARRLRKRDGNRCRAG